MKRLLAAAALIAYCNGALAAATHVTCKNRATNAPLFLVAKNKGLKEDWVASSITADSTMSLPEKLGQLDLLHAVYTTTSASTTTAQVAKAAEDACEAVLKSP